MKSKDPAFLFYATDFYEGTRTMLPEERACYVDLMIYQHQHRFIPLDLDSMLRYCTSIDKATLQATLKAKFSQTEEGYYNEKLKGVILERKKYSTNQSINGKIGQFWKKSKAILSISNYNKLRKILKDTTKDDLIDLIKDKDINKTTLSALLEGSLKHLEVEIEVEIENKNEVENKEKKITEEAVIIYFESNGYKKEEAKKFFHFYSGNDWKDSNDKVVKNWKNKARSIWFTDENKMKPKIRKYAVFCGDRTTYLTKEKFEKDNMEAGGYEINLKDWKDE